MILCLFFFTKHIWPLLHISLSFPRQLDSWQRGACVAWAFFLCSRICYMKTTITVIRQRINTSTLRNINGAGLSGALLINLQEWMNKSCSGAMVCWVCCTYWAENNNNSLWSWWLVLIKYMCKWKCEKQMTSILVRMLMWEIK